MKNMFSFLKGLTNLPPLLKITSLFILLICTGAVQAAETTQYVVAYANVPLTAGMRNASLGVFKLNGTTWEVSKDISINSTPSAAGAYYNSTELSSIRTLTNWGTSSSSKRTIGGLSLEKGKTYTINLGSQTISKIEMLGCREGKSGTITIDNQTCEGWGDKKFGLFEVSGSFTGDVAISVGTANNFRGILIFTVGQSSNPIVTYDYKDGTSKTTTATYTGTALTLPTPTRDGYTFAGWFTDATSGTPVPNPYTPTDNTTLYAHWTENKYTLSYNANTPNPWSLAASKIPYTVALMPSDASDVRVTTVSTTTPTCYQNNSTNYAIYTFNNWNTKADGSGKSYDAGASITLTENTTLYAQWTAASFSIKYYDSDNTELTKLTPASYTYGTDVTFPTPTKTGYTFKAWHQTSITGTVVTSTGSNFGDFVLYAEWEAITVTTYIVTYTPNGGTCDKTSDTYTTGGTALTLPTPTYTGYTFQGWYDAATGGKKIGDAGASYTPTANITLYAQWTETVDATNTIILALSEATVSNSTYTWSGNNNKVLKDKTVYVELPTDAASGTIAWKGTGSADNRFLYIYKDNGSTKDTERPIAYNTNYDTISFTSSDIVTRNGKPYLKFATTDDYKWANCQLIVGATPTGYTITYQTNGGTSVAQATNQTNLPTSFPETTQDGYNFEGWYTDKALTTQATAGGALTQDTTLYAKWTESAAYCGELMRGTFAGENKITVSGKYAGSGAAKIASGGKLGSNGSYIQLTLKDETFQDGDYVEVNVKSINDATSLLLYADAGTTQWASKTPVVIGKNKIYLPAAAVGKSTVYLWRLSVDNNASVDTMIICRPCSTECTAPTTVEINNTDISTLTAGESITFAASVDASGVTYQWYQNGTAIDGATSSQYKFTAQDADIQKSFTIYCEVTGCDGTTKLSSEEASFTVIYSACNYVTKSSTLSATKGYDFGDQVLYLISNDYTPSSKNICGSAKYRYLSSVAIVYIEAGQPLSAIRFQGQRDKDRTITKVEVSDALDGTYTEITGYTKIDYKASTCGELGIQNVYLAVGKYVKFTFDDLFRISGLCVDGVTCGDDMPQIVEGNKSTASTGCDETIELKLVESDGTTAVSAGTAQWYRNNQPIEGATGYSYTATMEGTYYATLTDNCEVQSSNSAVVKSENTPALEKASLKRFINDTLSTYKETTVYPLFDITAKGTTTDNIQYETQVTVHHSNATVAVATAVDWLREDARDTTINTTTNKNIYSISLGINYPKLKNWCNTNNLAVGDSIFVRVAPVNGCDEVDTKIVDSIPIIISRRHTLGYIVSGTLNGSISDVTPSDITDSLYTGLQKLYDVTPLNAYSAYNYENYEPYDLLLLTDYPNAKAHNASVDALADLVDKKPILSLKAHMSSLTSWAVKGFTSNPVAPGKEKSAKEAQKTLTVLCFSHDMFHDAIWDNATDRTITILDSIGKDGEKYKGLQGFEATAASDFMNIATIYDSNTGQTLIACCERQNVVEARFVMLSVNSASTKYINDKGVKMIDLLLAYLLETDPNKVSDCALTFDNGGTEHRTGSGDGQWGTAANWTDGVVPTQAHNVRIEANCTVSGKVYEVANVRLNKNYTITIEPEAGLASVGKFASYETGHPISATPITDPTRITVMADASHTGLLIHANEDQLAATVQMYSPAHYDASKLTAAGNPTRYWAYVGIPIESARVPENFRDAFTYLWNEATCWKRYKDGSTLPAWGGIGLSQETPLIFTFAGNLMLAKPYTFTLTNTVGSNGKGMNMIGNSWTAPLQIAKLDSADFGEGLDPTIYLYNTGRDPQSGPSSTGTDYTKATAGQWMTIPIYLAAQTGYAGPKVIPAMQAFEVNFKEDATQTSASFTLDYDKLVRASSYNSDFNQKLYAPKRVAASEYDDEEEYYDDDEIEEPAPTIEPIMLRLQMESNSKRADLYLLQGESFHTGYDAGWDGYYQSGDTRAVGIYALSENGNLAVSAQPQLAGTTLGTVTDANDDYLLTFTFTGGEGNYPVLYLNDMQQRQSTLIDNDAYYSFRTTETDMENRFVISDQPLDTQITTDLTEVVSDGENYLVSNPAGEQMHIAIYDAAGRLCGYMQTSDTMIQLEMPAAQGVYMVHAQGEHSQKVVKIVR